MFRYQQTFNIVWKTKFIFNLTFQFIKLKIKNLSEKKQLLFEHCNIFL